MRFISLCFLQYSSQLFYRNMKIELFDLDLTEQEKKYWRPKFKNFFLLNGEKIAALDEIWKAEVVNNICLVAFLEVKKQGKSQGNHLHFGINKGNSKGSFDFNKGWLNPSEKNYGKYENIQDTPAYQQGKSQPISTNKSQ